MLSPKIKLFSSRYSSGPLECPLECPPHRVQPWLCVNWCLVSDLSMSWWLVEESEVDMSCVGMVVEAETDMLENVLIYSVEVHDKRWWNSLNWNWNLSIGSWLYYVHFYMTDDKNDISGHLLLNLCQVPVQEREGSLSKPHNTNSSDVTGCFSTGY